jgi:hypothetical protein
MTNWFPTGSATGSQPFAGTPWARWFPPKGNHLQGTSLQVVPKVVPRQSRVGVEVQTGGAICGGNRTQPAHDTGGVSSRARAR